MRSGVKVPNLQLSKKANADHLNSCEDQDARDHEERTVEVHDRLPGKQLEDEQPDRESRTRESTQRADGSKKVQRTRHVLQQEPDCEQVKEDPEGAGDTVVALAKLATWIGDGNLTDTGSVP